MNKSCGECAKYPGCDPAGVAECVNHGYKNFLESLERRNENRRRGEDRRGKKERY